MPLAETPIALPYRDRRQAGQQLAAALADGPLPSAPLVLALPRGGVPVGYEVARALDAPLDVFVVRKLGLPWQPELAFGALASGGAIFVNHDVVRAAGLSQAAQAEVVAAERLELARRERAYRGSRPPQPLAGRNLVLVDDGLATGASMLAALAALRSAKIGHILVAVPVGAPESAALLAAEPGVEVCIPATPAPFVAVGRWYRQFEQVEDEEVGALLAAAAG